MKSLIIEWLENWILLLLLRSPGWKLNQTERCWQSFSPFTVVCFALLWKFIERNKKFVLFRVASTTSERASNFAGFCCFVGSFGLVVAWSGPGESLQLAVNHIISSSLCRYKDCSGSIDQTNWARGCVFWIVVVWIRRFVLNSTFFLSHFCFKQAIQKNRTTINQNVSRTHWLRSSSSGIAKSILPFIIAPFVRCLLLCFQSIQGSPWNTILSQGRETITFSLKIFHKTKLTRIPWKKGTVFFHYGPIIILSINVNERADEAGGCSNIWMKNKLLALVLLLQKLSSWFNVNVVVVLENL